MATSSLRVELTQASTDPIAVRATVHNDGKETLTLLPWDSPLDPSAKNLNVFNITVADGSGERAEFPRMMINRKVPVARSQLVEIGAGACRSQDVALDGPLSPIKKGTAYKIQAAGAWRAVWSSTAADVAEEDLTRLDASDAAATGPFESDTLEFTA